MKLILKQEVPNLGTLGDVVDVKPGYARNYLLPRGLALPVTGQQSKEFRHHMQYLEKMRKGEIAQAQQKAALMKVLDLEVTRKAGPGGRLFGSVNNRDIQEVLEAAGYTLERRAILLPAPIRNVGSHTFTVRVHTEVSIEMSIRVLAEFDPNAAPPEAEVAATTEAGEEAIEETEATAEEESAEAEEAS